jgi:hypothetical protein
MSRQRSPGTGDVVLDLVAVDPQAADDTRFVSAVAHPDRLPLQNPQQTAVQPDGYQFRDGRALRRPLHGQNARRRGILPG